MRTKVLGFLSVFLTCGSAFAADPQVISAPDVDPARFGWTGFYLGASGGYGWLNDIDRQFTPPLKTPGEDWGFGVHAGYLQQFGNFVVGAEAEYSRLGINFKGFPIDVENAYVLKARGGYAIDRFLVSGHFGASYATTNIGLEDWGWVAGAGVDYAVTDNIVIGAQYSHHSFKKFDRTLIDAKIDVVTARVGFKF